MDDLFQNKQVMVSKAIQTQNCLTLGVVNSSSCTGGAHIGLKKSKRLYALGLAECCVLKEDKYFIDLVAAEVYYIDCRLESH
jgi:hypothetical protein